MGHPDIDYMVAMERRRDELADAAHYRLLKEADLANPVQVRGTRFSLVSRLMDGVTLALANFLSLVGGRMLNWSCRLQYRYELVSGNPGRTSSPCS